MNKEKYSEKEIATLRALPAGMKCGQHEMYPWRGYDEWCACQPRDKHVPPVTTGRTCLTCGECYEILESSKSMSYCSTTCNPGLQVVEPLPDHGESNSHYHGFWER